MLSRLINAEAMLGDDFMKEVRAVRAMCGMWGACKGGKRGGDVQVEGPREAGEGTAHTGMCLTWRLGSHSESSGQTENISR